MFVLTSAASQHLVSFACQWLWWEDFPHGMGRGRERWQWSAWGLEDWSQLTAAWDGGSPLSTGSWEGGGQRWSSLPLRFTCQAQRSHLLATLKAQSEPHILPTPSQYPCPMGMSLSACWPPSCALQDAYWPTGRRHPQPFLTLPLALCSQISPVPAVPAVV